VLEIGSVTVVCLSPIRREKAGLRGQIGAWRKRPRRQHRHFHRNGHFLAKSPQPEI
jgi:hypothetical protein